MPEHPIACDPEIHEPTCGRSETLKTNPVRMCLSADGREKLKLERDSCNKVDEENWCSCTADACNSGSFIKSSKRIQSAMSILTMIVVCPLMKP